MPRRKKIIVPCRIVIARRRRKCYYNASHEICKGEKVLEVKEGMQWKGYCYECAEAMFAISVKQLNELQQQLGETKYPQ